MATPNVLETKAGNGQGPRTQMLPMATAADQRYNGCTDC